MSKPVRALVESALMIAIATVLSLFKIDLPFGGGLTICSMLPILLVGYRHGALSGILAAIAYSLIQLFLGFDNLSYATTPLAVFGVVFLDYILAYSVLGLGGLFRGMKNRRAALAIGIAVTFFLRFLCHWVAGAWIWGGWMPEEFMTLPMTSPWIYSALYNGWYMTAELVLTEIVTMALYFPLGKFFRGEDLA